MSIVVKRKRKREKFDERKVYASVYAACASAQYSEKKCEKTAEEICKKVKTFIRNKKQIGSYDIRKKITDLLRKKSKELAYYYEEHLPNLKEL